ncbi:lipopolysaccharide biosynthesis protein [Butyrivibrio fibrisolvens]|uniref:lipopolysaccharide biosynthesis protein n=1 Tax=Butyrivibrio fibrisolvens TaxID=831 RepID=UPI0012BCA9C3|nr:hypothetical protein [Butyrivibrio fibrisolvens]
MNNKQEKIHLDKTIRKREKGAVLQLVASVFSISVASLMPFIVRTFLIRFIGIEYVGVGALISSMLQVLNVADFGVSSALAFFLFEPIAKNDWNRINAIMLFFRKIYRAVGVFIMVGSLAIIPLIPILIKGKEYPNGLNIFIIFIFYMIQACFGYLTNNYIYTFLIANLQNHINSVIIGISLLCMYTTQIVAIIVFRNYYIFSALLLVSPLLQFFLYEIIKIKKFPQLIFEGKLSDDFIIGFRQRLIPMILSKIRIISRNSLDSIIISRFFGLILLAEYQNYYQVMLVPCMFSQAIRSAFQPSLGNGIVEESDKSNYGIIKQFSFFNNFVATISTVCILSLIQPFMKIWVGEKFILGNNVVICIAAYYYVLTLAESNIMLREASGIWREGRWVPVVEAVTNLLLNVLLAKTLGLYGIILATILTVGLINVPFESYYVFKNSFKGMYYSYIKLIVIYSIESLIIVVISCLLCLRIAVVNYTFILLRILASFFIPTMLFILIHFKDVEMKDAYGLLKRVLINIKSKISA